MFSVQYTVRSEKRRNAVRGINPKVGDRRSVCLRERRRAAITDQPLDRIRERKSQELSHAADSTAAIRSYKLQSTASGWNNLKPSWTCNLKTEVQL
jgi:hypothetical protein